MEDKLLSKILYSNGTCFVTLDNKREVFIINYMLMLRELNKNKKSIYLPFTYQWAEENKSLVKIVSLIDFYEGDKDKIYKDLY